MLKSFTSLKITLATSEDILRWSKGEVTKAETINYRTMRSEVDGLFCEKIFGPSKNFECFCGKYKKIRYKGIICDKCGVELTHKRVRRERMGHVKLAVPVVHIWYSNGTPNKLASILELPQKDLDSVIYFSKHMIVDINDTKKKEVLNLVKSQSNERAEQLHSDLQEALKVATKEFETESKDALKEVKNNPKFEMQLVKLEQDKARVIARVREDFSNQEIELRNTNARVLKLVESIQVGRVISQDDLELLDQSGYVFFDSMIGAEAVLALLDRLNVTEELKKLEAAKASTENVLKIKKIVQRMRLLTGMRDAGIKPSSMVMTILPVIPPELRPIVQLSGGRFATSDLNDLYRRIINRNNRLKKLMEIGAPELILRNEKRMLQESVDALIDNEHRSGVPILNSKGLPYKSLSDLLRGKQGRFRQNLLGKRVDYSGRAVIAPGPQLSIYECGLPQPMALELFKPYILRDIMAKGYAANIKAARLFFEAKYPEVLEILEEVMKGRPVLLNRAPTLHKQGVQAFYPKVVEGNAIKINPLVCKGFNADFDGDQMAVHLPLTPKAIEEAKSKMMVDSNVLILRDGSPVIGPARDITIGIYYLTKSVSDLGIKGVFNSTASALTAYDVKQVDFDDNIKVIIEGNLLITTIGRIIFNQTLPYGYAFINKQMDGKSLNELIANIFVKYNSKAAIETLDQIKDLGLSWFTKSGLSVSIEDFVISANRSTLLDKYNSQEDDLTDAYYDGLLSENEKSKKSQMIWSEAKEKIANENWKEISSSNPLYIFDKSGGLPIYDPVSISSGIKGQVIDGTGKVVPLPIRSNFRLGLSTFEYFVATRGTRKGLADTALKTSESGYLTRRLVDVGQDLITRIEDCGVRNGIVMAKSAKRRQEFDRRITGRFAVDDIMINDELIIRANEMIDPISAKRIAEKLDSVKVRSTLTCLAHEGVCAKCYGSNLSTQKATDLGFAAGMVAGQAMGEAATQLTLNTKHLSAKVGTDITQGLPRVEELFECRTPKNPAYIAEIDGTISVKEIELADKLSGIIKVKKILRISNTVDVVREYKIQDDDRPQFKDLKKVKRNEVLLIKPDSSVIKAPVNGEAKIVNGILLFNGTQDVEAEYELRSDHILEVEEGQMVKKGQSLTSGSVDPKQLMQFGDLRLAQEYLINHLQDVYGIQGIAIDDKHLEIIVRKMSDFVEIIDAGDSLYLIGDVASYSQVENINLELASKGKKQVRFIRKLLGITNAASNAESFLSSASFQEQVMALSNAAIVGKVDYLKGLKENVIIGRLVPLGENYKSI